MALPPEPLQELLFDATAVVEAEVVEVLESGPEPQPPPHAKHLKPGATSVGYLSAAQKVRLKVKRALKGESAAELVVDKPEAPYLLAPGHRGAFFLEGERILGRYGPDTHSVAAIERALKAR